MTVDTRSEHHESAGGGPPGTEERTALRAAAVRRLELVDRLKTPALAGVTRLAAHLTGASAAAVHVFDEGTQHRVASSGAPLGDHPASDSMCLQVVDGEQRVVCTDATLDGRFGYSSFVRGDRPVRFYAAVPIRARGGITVGTVCAFDETPRELAAEPVTRAEDAVARLGDDEFAVMAELLEQDDPGPVLERITRALHPSGGQAIPTASLGAVIAHPDDDVRTALRRADEAMYATKRGDRSNEASGG